MPRINHELINGKLMIIRVIIYYVSVGLHFDGGDPIVFCGFYVWRQNNFCRVRKTL